MKIRLLLLLVLLLQFACQRDPESRAAAAIVQAKKAMASNDYSRALLQLRIALKESPANAEAYYQAGLVHLKLLEIPSAFVNLKKAVEINPKHIEAQNRLAELFSSSNRQDHLEHAAELAQQVLLIDPEDSSAINSLAIVSFKLGDREAAVNALNKAVKTHKADVRSYVNAALMKVQVKDIQGAVKILRQAVEQKPDSQELALVLCRVYAANGDLENAIAVLSRAAEMQSADGMTWATQGSLFATQNRPVDALKAYRRAAASADGKFAHFPAMYLWTTGQRADSISELQSLYREDPRNYAHRRRLVNALRLNGSEDQANRILKEAFEKNPKDTEALVGHCQSLVRAGRLDEAISKLRQIIADDAANFRAHYLLSKVFQARRQVGLQRQELDETLRLNPDFLTARIELAKAQISMSRVMAAIEVLNNAPDEQKRTALWHEGMNWALLSKGDLAAAGRSIDRLLSEAPTEDAPLQKAFLQMAKKEFDAARVSLRNILAAKPAAVLAFDSLGNSYAYQRKLKEGLIELKKHSESHPKLTAIQFAYSIWLSRAGQLGEAEAVLLAAKSHAPNALSIDVRLGELAFAGKRFSDARKHLARALSQNPGVPRGQLLLAHVENISGNRELAMAGYRFVLELDSENAEAMNNLASLLSQDKAALNEALQFAQRAKELSPNDPNYSDTLGWILYQKGLVREAIPVLEAGEKSSNPVNGFHLAMAYAQSGDDLRARSTYNRAYRNRPDLPEAKQALDLISNLKSRPIK